MPSRDRRGFTLVELLVVTVLGALVIAATLEVLITNQRTYTAQDAQVRGQQATRMALDILTSELREVSARGGDLIGMGTDSIRVRRMRTFGIVCQVYLSGNSDFTILKVGDFFQTGDSVFVFADNDENIDSDDAWVGARVTGVDSTRTCPDGSEAEAVRFAGQDALFKAPTGDSVRIGAPIRNYVYYTYGTTEYDGDVYLGRREAAGDYIPIAGPLRSTSGLAFAYRDSIGATTGTATKVRQIVIKVRTGSDVMNSLGHMVSDSITAWIYTRN